MGRAKKLCVAISGPSGVGKGRIVEALELGVRLGWASYQLDAVVMYNTRSIRPGEEDGVHYWYCYGEFLDDPDDQRRQRRIAVAERHKAPLEGVEVIGDGPLLARRVRMDTQGVYLPDLATAAAGGSVAFMDINPDFLQEIRRQAREQPWGADVMIRSIYVAPMTSMEILRRVRETGASWEDVVKEAMRERIAERRAVGRSKEDEEELEIRATSAIPEMKAAIEQPERHDVIVVNPCGEGHPDWGTPHTAPVGRAAETVSAIHGAIEAWVRQAAEGTAT